MKIFSWKSFFWDLSKSMASMSLYWTYSDTSCSIFSLWLEHFRAFQNGQFYHFQKKIRTYFFIKWFRCSSSIYLIFYVNNTIYLRMVPRFLWYSWYSSVFFQFFSHRLKLFSYNSFITEHLFKGNINYFVFNIRRNKH